MLGLLATALFPTASRADGIPSGAWKGTVGKAPVMVCFSESGESHYYYLRHRRGIRLAPSETSNNQGNSPEATANAWQAGRFELDEFVPREDSEGKASGHWLLYAKSTTEITGTWAAPGHGKILPIALHKAAPRPPVGSPDAGWGCEQAFYQPIVAGMHLTFHPATFAGHPYQEVSSEEGTSFEVPAELPRAKALNRYAMEWLRSQSILAYDCSAGRGFSSIEPIGSSLKPVLWTDQYLVLQDSMPEIYCGGAHGSSSLSYLTWSWFQGRLVDTWAWLQGGEKSLYSHATKKGYPIRSGLFRLIAKLHPRNEDGDECREFLDQMSVPAPYPTAQGLVFNTNFFHAARACNDQVTLEWKQLIPYLSNEGRTLANQFRQ
jgi:hypothetical protein